MRRRTPHGYIVVKVADGRWQYEHRVVMESVFNRPLSPKEIVHHVNGDTTDNRPENLKLLPSQSVHRMEHGRWEEFICEACGKTSILNQSDLKFPKTKRGRRRFCSRRCMGIALRGKPFSGQPYRGGNNQWRNDGIRSARQQQEVPA